MPLIAVVDDEELVYRAMQRLLRSAGFTVETFQTGASFLSAMRQHTPDCVILDINMPGMTGFEVLHAMASQGVRAPVLIVTALDSAESRQQALEQGAVGYLPKPVGAEQLIRAINEAIGGYREGHAIIPDP